MTETRIDELKHVLGARRRRLQRDLDTKLREARAHTSGERESRGLDTAEISDADLQQDVGLALIEMSAEVLRRIDDAVARLASGTYGCCAACGDEIAQRRLEALPFAVRCRDCEEAWEISARRSRPLAQERGGAFDWTDATSRD
jgi:RNA polymerase-binding transcription factor